MHVVVVVVVVVDVDVRCESTHLRGLRPTVHVSRLNRGSRQLKKAHRKEVPNPLPLRPTLDTDNDKNAKNKKVNKEEEKKLQK